MLYASGTGTLAGTSTPNLKTTLALNNVENTALSTWAGSTNLTTLGTIGTGVWNGTTIAVNKGGTGQTSFSQGWLNSDGTNLSASTSPTVNYITATSTTATSTFATGGLTVGTNQFVVQQTTGNVGIGTAAPGAVTPNGWARQGKLLDIASPSVSTDAGLLLSRSDGVTASQIWHDGAEWDLYIDNYYNNDEADIFLRTKTAGTPVNAVTIKGSGNVGIGTAAPSAKLDVSAGNIDIDNTTNANRRHYH